VLAGPLFGPVLDPGLDLVSGHLGTRVSIPPYLKSSDDTLLIPDKSPYPVLFGFSKSE
jgi:hypothetical protein